MIPFDWFREDLFSSVGGIDTNNGGYVRKSLNTKWVIHTKALW
jgi:hypothetical protein